MISGIRLVDAEWILKAVLKRLNGLPNDIAIK